MTAVEIASDVWRIPTAPYDVVQDVQRILLTHAHADHAGRPR